MTDNFSTKKGANDPYYDLRVHTDDNWDTGFMRVGHKINLHIRTCSWVS